MNLLQEFARYIVSLANVKSILLMSVAEIDKILHDCSDDSDCKEYIKQLLNAHGRGVLEYYRGFLSNERYILLYVNGISYEFFDVDNVFGQFIIKLTLKHDLNIKLYSYVNISGHWCIYIGNSNLLIITNKDSLGLEYPPGGNILMLDLIENNEDLEDQHNFLVFAYYSDDLDNPEIEGFWEKNALMAGITKFAHGHYLHRDFKYYIGCIVLNDRTGQKIIIET